jgi:hypothetical protein
VVSWFYVVDKSGRASLGAPVARSAVLAGGEIQVPLIQQGSLCSSSGGALALVSFDLSSVPFRLMYAKCAATAPAFVPPPVTLIITSGVYVE